MYNLSIKNIKGIFMPKINELKEGHRYFKSVKFKQNENRFKKLVNEGQNPKALFIGCSDSRVMPAMITGSGPGDLFIVRNIGNFVPPFSPDNDFHSTASAIEYAVSHLEVSDIIICGHSDCGAIKECFLEHKVSDENIHTVKWLELGLPAKEIAQEELPNASLSEQREFAEKVSILFQMENLTTFPAVKRRVEDGTLFLHAWYYDLSNGEILYYDEEENDFIPLGE